MKKIITYVFAASLASVGQSGLGSDRSVVVNGQLLDADSLVDLDAAAGEQIPDGRYWMDFQSGAWGYEGGPFQGYIGARHHGGPAVDQAYETKYQALAGFGRRDLEREFSAVIDAALYAQFARDTYSQSYGGPGDSENMEDWLTDGHSERPSAAQMGRRIAEDTLTGARATSCKLGANMRETCIGSINSAAVRAGLTFGPDFIGTVAAVCARLLELEEGCD